MTVDSRDAHSATALVEQYLLLLEERDAKIASLTAQLARCREETAEGFKPEFKKHAWLRSEAILRGAFKSGIDIDAEYVRALAPTTGDGR